VLCGVSCGNAQGRMSAHIQPAPLAPHQPAREQQRSRAWNVSGTPCRAAGWVEASGATTRHVLRAPPAVPHSSSLPSGLQAHGRARGIGPPLLSVGCLGSRLPTGRQQAPQPGGRWLPPSHVVTQRDSPRVVAIQPAEPACKEQGGPRHT
jgi:hypothetical protein